MSLPEHALQPSQTTAVFSPVKLGTPELEQASSPVQYVTPEDETPFVR